MSSPTFNEVMLEEHDKSGGTPIGTKKVTAYGWTGTEKVRLKVDATGTLYVTGGGGGTQYAEDAAHSSGDTGTLALVVRKDAAAQLAGTDGDYSALITDANGRLHVLDQNSLAIKTAVETIDNAISGSEMQVDIVSIAAGNNNIGNVDIVSQPADTFIAEDGALGKGVLLQGDDGTDRKNIAVDASGLLQVDIAAESASVTVDQGTASNLKCEEASATAIKTAVELIDNAISGNEMQVDVVTMPTTTVQATDLDIRDLTNASDSILVYGSDDGGTTKRVIKTDAGGAIQVDIESVDTELTTDDLDTGAGTDTRAVMGLVQAESGGGVLVGSANPLRIDPTGTTTQPVSGTITANLGATDNAVLDQIELNTDPLLVVGGGTEATAIRVTIANDSTGLLSVDDGAGSLTIDNADITSIKTAVQIMDDWDATHDAAASADGIQLMGAYDSTKPTAVADGDAVRILADSYGRLLRGVEPEAFQATITSADATSATSVKAKTASKKMYIHTIIYSVDTAMSVQFQDDAGTPVVLVEQNYHAANSGAVLKFDPSTPLIVATNQDLDVLASAAGNISVTVVGYLA